MVPVGDLILRPLEARYLPSPAVPDITGVIVLGGSEEAWLSARWDQVVFGEGAERFTGALALARAHPQARIVFTGGSGALRDVGRSDESSATVATRFFTEQGIDPARLSIEGTSRNTAENARLTRALINPQPGEAWVPVTSAFRTPRAMEGFRAAGWKGMVPWPEDFRARDLDVGIGWELARNLDVVSTAVREYMGILAYWATGQ